MERLRTEVEALNRSEYLSSPYFKEKAVEQLLINEIEEKNKHNLRKIQRAFNVLKRFLFLKLFRFFRVWRFGDNVYIPLPSDEFKVRPPSIGLAAKDHGETHDVDVSNSHFQEVLSERRIAGVQGILQGLVLLTAACEAKSIARAFNLLRCLPTAREEMKTLHTKLSDIGECSSYTYLHAH